jgi:hypothetical protein
MLIDLFYALYQLAFLGFVVALVKHQRYAWLFLMLSCLLKIATMQDFSNINLGYLHYYLPEIVMIIISMIGYVSYSVDSQKNIFQKISLLKKIILFVIAMSISFLVYFLLVHIVLGAPFTAISISLGVHIVEYGFIIFALLLAIFKLPLAFASLFIAFLLNIVTQVELLLNLTHYLSSFCFNSTYILTLMVIAIVIYMRNRNLPFCNSGL